MVEFMFSFVLCPSPSVGRAQPDRSWGWTTPRRKNCRAFVAQPAVRPHLIVFLTVVAHHDPRFRQRPQLFPVQALIPETALKAFHKPVLPRAARLNVDRFDPIRFQPPLHLNSEPLSLRRCSGAPGCSTAFRSQCNTSAAFIARSAHST